MTNKAPWDEEIPRWQVPFLVLFDAATIAAIPLQYLMRKIKMKYLKHIEMCVFTALVINNIAVQANAGSYDYATDTTIEVVNQNPPDERSPFAGLYFGGQVKTMIAPETFTYDFGGKNEEFNAVDVGGFGYGGFVGFNIVTNSGVVFGLEGNMQWFDSGETVECHGDCYACSEGIDALKSIRARLGYAPNRTMFYGFVGFASADVTAGVAHPDGSNAQTFSGVVTGMQYGVGIEHMLNDNFSLGLEYVINDLDSFAFEAFNRDHVAGFSNSEIVARISYHF